MHWISPRAKATVSTRWPHRSRLPRHRHPTSVCNSSMNRIVFLARRTSFITALIRSSNCPRYLVPATIIAKIEDHDTFFGQNFGNVTGDHALRETLRRSPFFRLPLRRARRDYSWCGDRALEWRVRFLVCRPMTGSSLLCSRQFGQVATEAIERWCLRLAPL